MAISIPEYPSFESPAERKVWKVLTKELPLQSTIIHGAKIEYRGSTLEADFIVVWPGKGIVFIEVKGGRIRLHGSAWSTTNGAGVRKTVKPDEQARNVGHAFQEHYVTATNRSLHFGWLVVFPDSDLPVGTETNACPRKRIVDESDLGGIKE